MITQNTLFYGDNLNILREYLADESVDLIYLDPPFSSNRNYNVLFRNENGAQSAAQITAFEDTWHWNETTALAYHELITTAAPQIASMISALRECIGENQMMAYLVMMAARLVELHRVLKPTGSLYLHCDPTASRYLGIILDAIFDAANFRNEIIWKRQSAHSDAKYKFPDVADILLFYVKSKHAPFTPQYSDHNTDYIAKFYRHDDHDGRGRYRLDNIASPNPRPKMMYEWMGFACPEKGWRYQKDTMQKLHDEGRIWYPLNAEKTFDTSRRPQLKRYLQEQEGSIITCIWTDIQSLHSVASETLNYPTQKPVALLERIISASSKEDDVVLDPFCGCGTTIHAAQKLNRKWIGIDITHLAIALQKYRLKDAFNLLEKQDYRVIGEPEDLDGARQLAHDDPYQFQWWALSLIQAQPLGGHTGGKTGKKGKDRGIDGVIAFVDDATGKLKRLLVQVKSGKVKSGDIRDLRGTVERENAAMGVFITLEPPSKEMESEAAAADMYVSPGWNKPYPKMQILTIEQLLTGAAVQMPPSGMTFKKAQREQPAAHQEPLL